MPGCGRRVFARGPPALFPLCGLRFVVRRAGRGPGPGPRGWSRGAPLLGERGPGGAAVRVARSLSWAARLGSPRGNRRPRRAPRAPLSRRRRTRAHAHTLGRCWRGRGAPGGASSWERARGRLGSPSHPRPALPIHRALGPLEPCPGSVATRAAGPRRGVCVLGGVSLLVPQDESGHGRPRRCSRTVAAAAASLHIQVENFQESAETLCPKTTESQLPPNPGGDSSWKTSLR